ncbi:MAG: glycosyltransferase family 2 protein [Tabrizicola sp.]|nr:glycosyltransferase family 2 protein [Tabrizicola sp.]
MTASAPFFTVVMATWGRGRHILPSIQSVLEQDFRDFELIVVGDACTDETEAMVTGLEDPRVRWLNLSRRVGSQSGPNNAGIAAARGEFIAYLGHDDIWAPSHLSAVAEASRADPTVDFIVSGLIDHLPNDLRGGWIYGLATEAPAPRRHHYPPSCFAHRKAVIDVIGPWQRPESLSAPVDVDFLERAAAAGLRFRSTGVVTVHKFSAAARYLCYVQPNAEEQEAMLADFRSPGHAARVEAIIAEARRCGTYMTAFARDFSHRAAGEELAKSTIRRGILRPALQELGRGAVIRQLPGPCGLDWLYRPFLGIRLHTRNPRPRFLLPFTANGPVRLSIRVVHPDRAAFGPMALSCNGETVTAHPGAIRRSLWGWTARYEAVITLRPDAASLVEFQLSEAQRRKRRIATLDIGLGIGRLRLRPA